MKLDDDHPLVHLHQKFWQQGAQGDQLLNLHEVQGAEGDETAGCYVLDIGISCMWPTKIWVRREYMRMYQRCYDHLETKRNRQKSPSMVITGHPGIGKHWWLLYVLCRRLVQKEATLFYDSERLILFVEEGVFRAPPNFGCTEFKSRVWTLVDGDGDSGLPTSLAQPWTTHRIIFVSPPEEERWNCLRSTTTWSLSIMNPWTRGEISAAASIHGFEADDLCLDDMYSRLGPTPRICFDYSRDKDYLAVHELRIERSIAALSPRVLQEIVNDTSVFKTNDLSNAIFLLKRNDPSWCTTTVQPITCAVEMKLRVRLRKEMYVQRLQLYHSLANAQTSRGLAGIVYKTLAQDILQRHKSIQLDLIPMVRKGWKPWRSNHGDGVGPSSVRSFRITASESYAYSTRPDSIIEGVYYAPHSPNQVTLDSFIMHNELLFIFQFTIAPEHQIEKGLFDFFSHNSLPPKARWHFVFVVPPTLLELSCPHPQDTELAALLEEINLYTMVVDPDRPFELRPVLGGPALTGQVPAGLFPAESVPAGEVLAGQVLAGQVPAGQVLAGQVLLAEQMSAGPVLVGSGLAGQVPAGPVPVPEPDSEPQPQQDTGWGMGSWKRLKQLRKT
ncbi:hypothetical protein EI94DRAFT_1591703 [Lactarius quietus]|nr:hypothetical protein EI94DRAFT_1591703 [Lactarius quietus]